MKRIEIPIGTKYGRLTVIKEVDKVGSHRAFLCKCECGNIKVYRLSNIRKGTTKSCGCLHKENSRKAKRFDDLTGEVFGTLKVLKRIPATTKQYSPHWLCLCNCGEETVATTSNLRTGQKKSCGCKYGMTWTKWTKENEAEIIILKNEGKTYKEIAELTGRAYGAVAKRLAKLDKEAAKKKAIENLLEMHKKLENL